MNSRPCPVCHDSQPQVIMKFTPELISQANATYEVKRFQKAILDQASYLTYSRCGRCHMIYCEHVWPDAILHDVYEGTIDHEKSKAAMLSIDKRTWLVDEWNMILRVLTIHGRRSMDGLKVADYGSGWGDFLDVAKSSGVSSMGYDSDRIKTSHARSQGHKIAANIDEFKSFGPVHVFMMNSVLEHLQEPAEILAIAHEMLKPGGLLIVSVMDYREGFISKNIKELELNHMALTKNLNPVEHVNIYDYHTLRATLKRSGFQFFATEKVLTWANAPLPMIRNTRTWIRLLNSLEELSTNIFKDGDRSISAYAFKV